MTPLVIIGGGGHAREVFGIVEAVNGDHPRFEVLGFAADEYWDESELADLGLRRLGGVEETLQTVEAAYLIGIGLVTARRTIDGLATRYLRAPATLVHPDATLGREVSIGAGTIIGAGARLTTHVSVGRHVSIGPNCVVSHDCALDDFVNLHAGVCISGRVHLYEAVTMGTGSCVIERLSIGTGTTVGAGSTVVRDLPAGVTAMGTPARVAP